MLIRFCVVWLMLYLERLSGVGAYHFVSAVGVGE